MVDKDQCHIEVVEPRNIWIMPMGFEVDTTTLDAYAQHLLIQPVDDKEERFDTCKEKDLDLYKNFIGPARKSKVRREVEKLTK